MTQTYEEIEASSKYGRIERVMSEVLELALPREAKTYDLRPGPVLKHQQRLKAIRVPEVRGTVEDFAYLPAPFNIPAVKIDGGWLELKHRRLREAFRALRPEVGEEIVVECLGRDGREYEYAVRVGERVWPAA